MNTPPKRTWALALAGRVSVWAIAAIPWSTDKLLPGYGFSLLPECGQGFGQGLDNV